MLCCCANTTIQGTTNENNGTSNRDSEMADGDEDESDDGDEGDDDEDEHGDSDLPDTSIVEESKDNDETMTDALPVPVEVKEMVADAAAADKLPANPMTLPPPLASLASDVSTKVEGSPLKNVLVPSPTEVKPPETLRNLLGQPADVETGSTVAEPPSTIVGEEPEAAENRDLELAPTVSEALLPPPPEQVGNIATPKADDTSSRVSDNEYKSKESEHTTTERSFQHQDSVMTEDTIKPEDSASVRFPLTESGAPSEVGTASVDESKEPLPAPASGPMEIEDQPAPAPALPASQELAPDTRPQREPPAPEQPTEAEEPKPEELKHEEPQHEELPAPPLAVVSEPEPQSAFEAVPPAAPSPSPVVAAPAELEPQPEPAAEEESREPLRSSPGAEPAGERKPAEAQTPHPVEPSVGSAPDESKAADQEPVAEPVVEPSAEHIAEPVTKPIVLEPIIMEPIVLEPIDLPPIVAEPAATESAAEPLAELVPEPLAEPGAAAEAEAAAEEPRKEDDTTNA